MKRAAIELETIVKIVMVLFALIVLVMFLTGNFLTLGGGITNVSQNITANTPSVADKINSFNISG